MTLTVGELKEAIKDLDDSIPVGVAGWFPEEYHRMTDPPWVENGWLVFEQVWVGEEPE